MGTFGESLRELLEETRYGTLNKLATEIEVTPSTLYRWVERADPSVPPRVLARIAKALKMPEGVVLERLTGQRGKSAMVRESASRFSDSDDDERIHYSQPLTDRTVAVQVLGRLEHYAARILKLNEEYTARIDEIMRMARDEIAKAREELLAKITHDDKGRRL